MKKLIKIFKNWTPIICIALVLSLFIRSNVFATALITTNYDSNYKINDKVAVNLLNKNPKVGDSIMFKDKNIPIIRTVTKIDGNIITVNNNGKELSINKQNIKGIVAFKIGL